MTYRKMLMSDYDGVWRIWHDDPGIGLRDGDDTPDGIERFLKRNPDTCFVCEEDGAIIGAIMCGHDGRRGHIYHAAVREDRRRNGIGSRLARLAIDALRDEGITKCTLVVYEDNAAGNGFWNALGFGTRNDLVYRDRLTELLPTEG